MVMTKENSTEQRREIKPNIFKYSVFQINKYILMQRYFKKMIESLHLR